MGVALITATPPYIRLFSVHLLITQFKSFPGKEHPQGRAQGFPSPQLSKTSRSLMPPPPPKVTVCVIFRVLLMTKLLYYNVYVHVYIYRGSTETWAFSHVRIPVLACLGMRSLLLTVKVLRPGTMRTGDGCAAGSLGSVSFSWGVGMWELVC